MKKGVLRNFAKFTGKHLCQILLFNKVILFFNKVILLNIIRVRELARHSEAYSGHCETSMVELFMKIQQALTISSKSSIIDILMLVNMCVLYC